MSQHCFKTLYIFQICSSDWDEQIAITPKVTKLLQLTPSIEEPLQNSWTTHLLNISNLINRHSPLNRIALTNGFCNSRRIEKRSLGRKRIATKTSAPANRDMMIIFIIFQSNLDASQPFLIAYHIHLHSITRRFLRYFTEASYRVLMAAQFPLIQTCNKDYQ